MKHVLAMAVLAVGALAARADEVVLRNGARFEGEVREQGNTVTVVMDFGSMTFRKSDVARIERGATALSEFDAKAHDLKSDDLEGKYKLALWGRSKGLDQRSRSLLEDILVRNPEHAGAREALGYRRHEGRWLTQEELNIERGLVLFRGEWIKRDVADEIRRIEAEKAAEAANAREIEFIRIRAAREAADAAARRAEEQAERERAIYDDRYYPRSYAPVWPGYFHHHGKQRVIRFGHTAIVYPGRNSCPPERK